MLTEDNIHEFRVMINELKEEFEEKYSKKNPDFYDGAKSFAKKLKEQLIDMKPEKTVEKIKKAIETKNTNDFQKAEKNTFTDSDHEVKTFINDTTKGFKDMFRKGKI